MYEFDDLWRFIVKRSVGFPTVQEYNELKHVFDKMQGCDSYLEIGTAEGNSLYVLSHALTKYAVITCVDLGEPHTRVHQQEILQLLERDGYGAIICMGNSRNPNTLRDDLRIKYDCVLIDGGHDYETVKSDALMYGHLAKKYIFFHDIMLPEVRRAYDEYCVGKKHYEVINSLTFGYGVIEVG